MLCILAFITMIVMAERIICECTHTRNGMNEYRRLFFCELIHLRCQHIFFLCILINVVCGEKISLMLFRFCTYECILYMNT